jgi:hypothetical protein
VLLYIRKFEMPNFCSTELAEKAPHCETSLFLLGQDGLDIGIDAFDEFAGRAKALDVPQKAHTMIVRGGDHFSDNAGLADSSFRREDDALILQNAP